VVNGFSIQDPNAVVAAAEPYKGSIQYAVLATAEPYKGSIQYAVLATAEPYKGSIQYAVLATAEPYKVRSKCAFRYAQAHDKNKPYCGGCPARSKALGSGPSLVGVQGFESLSPHNLNALAEITGYYPENAIQARDNLSGVFR